MKALMLVIIVALLALPAVTAKEGTIKLLALSELSNGSQAGEVTDLTLELKPGAEHVFIETFPLTKIPTQISMRFAQQIACNALDADCGSYDFFYTIKSLQGLVGGPSAGAAATILTAALLTDANLDASMTITGTINSGGLIGPVGGVKQKLEAAAKNELKTVLIPKGTRQVREGTKSIDLVEYGKKLGVNVIEVATFDEAFEKMTGESVKKPQTDFVIEEKYAQVMKQVAEDICSRVSNISVQLKRLPVNKSEVDAVLGVSKKAQDAFVNQEYYSAASYCFRTNVLLQQLKTQVHVPSANKVLKDLKKSVVELNDLVENLTGRKVLTITDIQTYMAVDERLVEAKDALQNARQKVNNPSESEKYIIYAQERLSSAQAWSRFFDNGDKRFDISPSALKQSCMNKISEAEERYSYVRTVIPVDLTETRKELDRSYIDLVNQSYVMCLYRASKAKASSDVILSVLGVESSQIDDVLNLKLEVVKNELSKSQQRGFFPIIGYSYYEYANSLKNTDKSSALLFAEYALELANLDVYFERRTLQHILPVALTRENTFVFFVGILVGAGVFATHEYCVRFRRKQRGKKKFTTLE